MLRDRHQRGAQLYLGSEPSAVAEFADDVDFETGAVAVVEQLAPVCLGVHPQIAHDERFEQQAEQAVIGVEPFGAGSQRCHSERGVGEQPLGVLAQSGA